jgi:hypothetical protein
LPALARLAGGPDRRVAIPAARAARQIARELSHHELADDVAADEVEQWRSAFEAIARGADHFVEVRLDALDTASALARVADPAALGFALDPLLADRDPAVRAAAVALVPQPAPVALRAPLAATVIGDVDPHVALGAAQALCADLAIDDPAPVIAALGPRGIDRIHALIANDHGAAARDAARCLKKK